MVELTLSRALFVMEKPILVETEERALLLRNWWFCVCVLVKTALGKQKYFVSIISKIYNMNNAEIESLVNLGGI